MIIKFNTNEEGNGEFHKGSNVTVRRYGGQYTKKPIQIGGAIVLSDLADNLLGFGTVTKVFIGPMGEIPQEFLNYEHNPLCSDHRGLKKVLTSVYGSCVRMTDAVIAIMFDYEDADGWKMLKR